MNMLPAVPTYGYEAPPFYPHYPYNMSMAAAYSSPIPSYSFPIKSESSDDSSPTSRNKQFTNPDEEIRYREKRSRNNVAAQKSRKVRKQREEEAVKKANNLEQENKQLKDEVKALKQLNEQLKQQLQSSLCNRCSGFLIDQNPFTTTTAQNIQLAAQFLRESADGETKSMINQENEGNEEKKSQHLPFIQPFFSHQWII